MSKHLNQIKAYANKKNLPVIPISAKNLIIINEPENFYQSILDNTRATKHRLALSALYLGTGPKEQAIIQCMLEALKSNKKLDINVVLDQNRARRLDNQGLCSVSLLNRVLDYNNTRLNLVDSNSDSSIINKLLRNFQKWNEISSTYHAKFLIFDNNLILTGANLSSIYFENRQDRYMMIKDAQVLSDYLSQLLDKLSFGTSICRAVKAHNEEYVELLSRSVERDSGISDSFVIPLTQHGPTGLKDKENFLQFLDSILPQGAQVYMSSGYFNPSPIVSSMKLESVLAPSEEANGFYGGGGLLRYVPRLYSSIYKKYLESHPQCQLRLYGRSGWSFHAKGLWVKGLDDLYIHLMGSSNFNYRSSDRDFEVQLLLLTKNKELIGKLEKERETLWRASDPIRSQDIKGLNWLYSTFAYLLKRFL